MSSNNNVAPFFWTTIIPIIDPKLMTQNCSIRSKNMERTLDICYRICLGQNTPRREKYASQMKNQTKPNQKSDKCNTICDVTYKRESELWKSSIHEKHVLESKSDAEVQITFFLSILVRNPRYLPTWSPSV